MRGFKMQCKVEILRVLRNPYYVFWSLFMPIVFYIVFTKIFNTDLENPKMWQAHILMSMTAFSVMGSAIMTLGIRLVEERKQGWSMFMRIVPISDQAYYFAKMIGQTMIHIFSILVIFTAGALINSIQLTTVEWLLCGLWILFGSFPFLAIGALVGTMKRVDTAAGVSNMVYFVFAILGGMWMPIELFPDILQTIGKVLPSFHFGSGAWQIVRGGGPDLTNFLVIGGYLIVFMLLSSYIRRKQEVAV
ncbi:ABC transporter permease [Ornithinibacillus halotolerans]|uniref:Transport permease YvfS n=1 Tax=Ornithinibacillus halotolerans TaxID=1274357 RepID=A0A916RW91_9BACI|nr:ABC transporter permease [Ornithinibacillus halotolerans]GGA72166.1 putative transport permease YvfS [Ornithinibacillus halotolerans]